MSKRARPEGVRPTSARQPRTDSEWAALVNDLERRLQSMEESLGAMPRDVAIVALSSRMEASPGRLDLYGRVLRWDHRGVPQIGPEVKVRSVRLHEGKAKVVQNVTTVENTTEEGGSGVFVELTPAAT